MLDPLAVSTSAAEQPLPKEVVAVLPTDPYEQLMLAHRITCSAFNQKVAALETEVGTLRRTVADRSKQVRVLETRLTTCQLELQDSLDKARHAAAVEERLQGEKQALVNNMRRLSRDLSKLDAFKRNLLHSLQEDQGEEGGATLLAELALDPPSPPRGKRDAPRDLPGVSSLPSVSLPHQTYSPIKPASHSQAPRSPQSSNRPRRANGQADDYSYRDASPQSRKRPPQPSAHHYPSATEEEYEDENEPRPNQGPKGAGRPPSGAAADRLDGKEFFRKARARLSGGTFSQFLDTIKDLNSGQASREEALKWAQDCFGPANADLYGAFEALLSRHLPAL